LGKLSDITLEMGKIEEACPLGLAPSASTTATLALTDALGLCVQKRRGFDKEQFAFYHPGGKLGRELQKVQDVMRTGERNPVVSEETPVLEAIGHITRARAGAISVADRDGKLAGFFTDGDLRRLMNKGADSLSRPIKTVMTRNPITIPPDHLAEEALRFLREKKIDELPVVDETGKPIGMLDVQDLLDVEMV
jgi:arabinose-5-phosphate isomerase